MLQQHAKRIFEFMALSERLKFELRYCWLSNGQQDNVAAHSYQMALLAIMVAPHLEHPVDLLTVLKMILVHDLVEAFPDVGDIPLQHQTGDIKTQKAEKEAKAIERIKNMLPSPIGEELFTLWWDYEKQNTSEARFVKALDKLEALTQHGMSDFTVLNVPEESQWVYTDLSKTCGYDLFLQTLANEVNTPLKNRKKMY